MLWIRESSKVFPWDAYWSRFINNKAIKDMLRYPKMFKFHSPIWKSWNLLDLKVYEIIKNFYGSWAHNFEVVTRNTFFFLFSRFDEYVFSHFLCFYSLIRRLFHFFVFSSTCFWYWFYRLDELLKFSADGKYITERKQKGNKFWRLREIGGNV